MKLIGWAFLVQFISHNLYKAVGADRRFHMDSHGILRCHLENLVFHVLLEPFEEQVNLPPVFV